MPPLVPTYTWTQDEHEIQVEIPLKGNKASGVDVFASRTYVKVSFGQYLLHLDLAKAIDDTTVKGAVHYKNKKDGERGGGYLVLTMQKEKGTAAAEDDETKAVTNVWPTLTLPSTSLLPKEEIQARRAQAVEERRVKEQAMDQTVKEAKMEAERLGIKARLDQERAQQKLLEEHRAKEKEQVEAMLFASSFSSSSSSSSRECDKENTNNGEGKGGKKKNRATLLPPPPSLPPVRNNAGQVVRLSFTPRLFPTPLRESKVAQEEEWVAKHIPQQMMMKKNDSHVEDENGDTRDVSERDAVWLRHKGDTLCRAGDYEAAIHAYTSALKIDGVVDRGHILFGHRALCFLQLGRFHECIQDCDDGLKAMTMAVMKAGKGEEDQDTTTNKQKKNNAMRVRLHARRGAALSQLGDFQSALDSYMIALEYAPDDAGLQEDVERLKCKLEMRESEKD